MLEASAYYVGMAWEGSIRPEEALQSLKTLVIVHQTTPHYFCTEKLHFSVQSGDQFANPLV